MREDEGAVKRLREEMAAVEFSSGLAIENPGMYTLDELRELIERNDKTAREIDELRTSRRCLRRCRRLCERCFLAAMSLTASGMRFLEKSKGINPVQFKSLLGHQVK